ncbi:MAG TPA: FMN-binding protein [Candidatus Limnocylindrales bacterium]|nr:FMN-binding protein [Candidatus Limnocylindrales bacterium]
MLRLSLVMAVIGIISAASLSGAYNLTAPIIAERQEREYRQALEGFFPAVAEYETQRIEDDYFDLIYDSNNNLLGFMAVVQQQGYGGLITFNLAADAEGSVIGIRVISHTETPGVGDVITTQPFLEQFHGKSYADRIEAGVDIDTVSSATVSTSAMIAAVHRAVNVIAENFLGMAEEALDITAVLDGVYQGSASGTMGDLVVEVEVLTGKIVRIDVLQQYETPTFFVETYPLIPNRIIEEQRLDIDTRTGATLSAERLINAIRDALTKPPVVN